MLKNLDIDIKNLFAACAAISVFGLAFGITYPLLSLILASQGTAENMIGINAAMMPIGILLFSPVIPVAASHFGARNVAITAALITAILILTYKIFYSLEAWFILRFLQGMSISTLFVLSEVWIVRFAGSHHRGKVIALYGSVFSLSFGAGPAIVSWTGIEGWAPFIIGSLVIVVGILPLMLIKNEKVRESKNSSVSGFFNFSSKAPMLLACVCAFSILDSASLSLLPVYGVRNGLDISTAALLLTAMVLGNSLLQFPIGWLADNFEHRKVLLCCSSVTAVMLCLLPFSMGTVWMWVVVLIAGTTGYGLYTVSLTSLGSRYEGAELVNGSSAFAVVWGAGALFGSISGGWTMTIFGPNGLPLHLAAIYGILAVGLAIRAYKLSRQT